MTLRRSCVCAIQKTKVIRCIRWQLEIHLEANNDFNITKGLWQQKGKLPNFLSTSKTRSNSRTNKPEPRNLFTFFVLLRLHPIFILSCEAECLRNSQVGNNWNIKFHYPSMEQWNWMEDEAWYVRKKCFRMFPLRHLAHSPCWQGVILRI